MNRKLNVGLSLAAGLLGGWLSHYVPLRAVHAQAQNQATREVRAQSFVVVNEQGAPVGVFGLEKDGTASIKLLDKDGNVAWAATAKKNPQLLGDNFAR